MSDYTYPGDFFQPEDEDDEEPTQFGYPLVENPDLPTPPLHPMCGPVFKHSDGSVHDHPTPPTRADIDRVLDLPFSAEERGWMLQRWVELAEAAE